MKDASAAVFSVLMIIGLSALILRWRDNNRHNVAISRVAGIIALLMGLTIFGWVAYNFIYPPEESPGRNPTVLKLISPLVMVYVGWRWLTSQGPGIEDTPMNFDCEELRASVGKAKVTMHWFLDQVDRNVDGAFIKFPLNTPNGMLEHIWAYVHSFRDGSFNVSLANDPIDKDQESSGRRDVALDEVEDWQIMRPDGRIKGAYSLIALFEHFESQGKKLSPKMRKQKAMLIDAGQGEEA